MVAGISDILTRVKGVKPLADKSYMACCPAHADKNPSLHISQKGDAILLKCQAGCATEAVMEALKLDMSDLFIGPNGNTLSTPPAIAATYDYKDKDGTLLYQVLRMTPKSFRQRRPDGKGGWINNLDGVKRVLYHYPDLCAVSGDTWYIVEGEKDADNLVLLGLLATTSAGGAQNWKPEYAKALEGKHIVIIPDKDAPGCQYAREVARSVKGVASEVKVIFLPGDVKDVSDWIEAGGDVAELPNLAQDVSILFEAEKPHYEIDEDAITWQRTAGEKAITFRAEKLSEDRTGIHARITIGLNDYNLAWSHLNIEKRDERSALATAAFKSIKGDALKSYEREDLAHDLDAFCAGLWDFHVSRFVPEEMAGDEQITPLSFLLHPYILQFGGTIIFAPPGRGKSYTAMLWAVSVDAGCQKYWACRQTKVLFINLERSRESLTRRLSAVNKVLGLPANRPLLTLNARGRSLSDVLPTCRKTIKDKKVGLIILDSISRAGLGDLNDNLSGNRIIDALSSMCPTWLALGHTSRANEEHMYGSVMQDAGADVCIQLSSQIKQDGTLGCGWQITKQNDIGYQAQKIYALTFSTDAGLVSLRLAKTMEFPDIESKRPADMETTIREWVANRETGDATATEVEKELGYSRPNVVRLFTQSGKYEISRKDKNSVYYRPVTG